MTDATLHIKVDASEVGKAKVSLDSLADSGKGAKASTDALTDSTKEATKATAKHTSATEAMVSAVKTAAAGFGLYKLGGLIRESALLHARFETLGVVMNVTGRNAGYSAAEMHQYELSLRKTGIAMVEARETLSRMAQAQLDLTKTSKLARVAQDAAVIGGINSSAAFERMVHGIRSGETEILRTIGINVNFEASYRTLEKELGRTKNGLNETEKSQARMNAVLEYGTKIAGAYEASMGTAGKQMQSMKRYVDDLKVKLGETFNDALTIAVFGFSDALKDASTEADNLAQNGSLREWGRDMVTVLAMLGDMLSGIAGGIMRMSTTVTVGIAQLGALARGDVKGAAAIGAAWKEDFDQYLRGIGSFTRAADDFYAKKEEKRVWDAGRDKRYYAELLIVQKAFANESVEVQRQAVQKLYDYHYPDAAKAPQAAPSSTGASDAEAEKARSKYESAIKASKDFIAQLKEERDTLGMTAQQQSMYAAEQVASIMSVAGVREKTIQSFLKAAGEESAALAKAQEAQKAREAADEHATEMRKQFATASEQSAKAAQQDAKTIEEQLIAQRLSNEEIGLSVDALFELKQARLDTAIAAAEQLEIERIAAGASNEEIAEIWKKIDALKALKAERGVGHVKQAGTDALKELNDYLDPAKAKSFGDALSNAFGKAGTAIGKMAGALDNYAQKQAELAKKQAVYEKNKGSMSSVERIEMETKLSQKQAEVQVGAYADMAGAAKSYFEEGSTGYKVLGAAEQAFRALQMMMSIRAMVQGTAETAKDVADAGVKASASGVAAFAKTLASLPFPWNLAAGAVVVGALVKMGVAMSGGGGASGGSSVPMSEQRQKSQGTGTVLGDPDAKSNSLANALDLLSDVNTLTMKYSARMAKSLQNIEVALTGVSSMIFRTPGLTSGNLSGVPEGVKSGFLGFSSKSVSVTDSGLTYKGKIAGIEEGLQAYTDVTTNKSSFWGLKKSSKTSTTLTDADDDISHQFGMIFENIADSIIAAGGVLGHSADILETQIANIEIDLGMVSLKGLKGDELEAALNAAISASADDIARQVLPGLEKYQKVGEGYYETAVRVAYSTEVVQASLKMVGKEFSGSAMEIVDFTQTLTTAFGGLEALTEVLGSYYEHYFTEQERFADSVVALNDGFTSLGLTMPKTTSEFRTLVDGIDGTTVAGAELLSNVLLMEDAFYNVASAVESAMATINSSYLNTVEQIQLSVMSDQEQYNYWRTAADTAYAAMKQATDPALIQGFWEDFNTATTNAYALVPDEQKPGVAADFIDYLGDGQDVATTSLSNSTQNIITAHDAAVADAVSAAVTAALAPLVADLVTAGTTQQQAADTNLIAAQTPIVVDVRNDAPVTSEVGP